MNQMARPVHELMCQILLKAMHKRCSAKDASQPLMPFQPTRYLHLYRELIDFRASAGVGSESLPVGYFK